MRTSEILDAVKNEFPNLDVRTLTAWREKGYLREPTQEGYGYKQGQSEYEWPADTLARVKIIAGACGQRVTKKAATALIAKGYFIGAPNIKNAVDDMITLMINAATHSKKSLFASPGCVEIFSHWGELIITNLITPPVIHLEAYKAAQNNPDELKSYSSISHFISFFSVHTIDRDLSIQSDLFIEKAFNASADVFNWVCPILGHYHGRIEYPVISNDRIPAYMNYAPNTGIEKLTRDEFECFVRLMIMVAIISCAVHKDELIDLIPSVLTQIIVGLGGGNTTVQHIEQYRNNKKNDVNCLLGGHHERTD